MNLVYLGSGEFGVPCLDALKASRHALALVVTQPANPAGRGRKPQSTPVAQWAAAHGVPVVETDNVNSPEMLTRIADCRPEVLVVIAFGQKIGPELVRLPAKGAINVHASLLPKYRGAAPINWAILRGETHTGNSIITLAEKIDAGDILAQSGTAIGLLETAGELHDRLAQSAAPLLLDRFVQSRRGSGAGPGFVVEAFLQVGQTALDRQHLGKLRLRIECPVAGHTADRGHGDGSGDHACQHRFIHDLSLKVRGWRHVPLDSS